MPAEAMEIAQGDMHQPDLRIGNPLPKPVDRLHFVLVQFVFARRDVDGDKLVLVRSRQTRANLLLDERVSATGKLLFAVTAFVSSHALPPVERGRCIIPWSGRTVRRTPRGTAVCPLGVPR